MAMNSELKQKWVIALRSGAYKQCCGRLRSSNEFFCALGVLCELCPGAQSIPGGYRFTLDRMWATGLEEDTGIEWGQILDIIALNENGANFPEIAAWIEEHV